MAKQKHPIYRLHKIKVHHNRWLIWAIAYVLFVAIALIGYIKVSDEAQSSQVAEQTFVSWHTYENPKLGFSLRYPASWAVEADEVSAIFAPESGQGIEVSVYKPNAERTIRKPLNVISESPVMVDGVKATGIVNDLGGGRVEGVVLAKTDRHIYVIRGSKSDINKILLTFNLIPIED
ncbi:MAG: hypothetical protein A3J07_03525 [Candidatus Doudnabacteria bacterium RIFCSPLOWO2_02_FULL_49_13]|uniref:Uncharacterized protein n=1 Tax=Candidatus Doudnabacteria bacterium RIFCSPHIGHO2_12_FULL_48_16 TaxID=1817838 RepID=A0A1F5PJX1_9BACT|nr:MAG: hypothetical protein A3B77_02325 [Candidatus Doudnabacteria bacterium RIFCSPHIGHO2_02_FULL_49_24]OGE89879.1 MAG: hypothetical protein A2760_03960 [Candidatus Doudnabacteria bacterium RIFCSPHIGHO2_01_FULL_50_67]OGE89990.1 MAG: hypothetical protein A3E29_02665 [Candidatus Doudnabacteria bacterium RIFCSPHIGHO2_12_FULL_48_16]OGE97465.1 MAG: hypothetical protein A2990_01970 [Candidatus Doudnabacteria bacterium RIFCSPLOWO2_01_FULL_49_40]OGF03134.1 MAG: hypothetical protein A3J07_03525 [Candid